MNIGLAARIFLDIESDEYTIFQKAQAIRMVLNMPTHNGFTKDKILEVTEWLWNQVFEEVKQDD